MSKISFIEVDNGYRINNIADLDLDVVKDHEIENIFCSLLWSYLWNNKLIQFNSLRILNIWHYSSKLQEKIYPVNGSSLHLIN